ncbi:MAG: hypothetical protein ABF711_00490 [Leuconostoc mesenteroides]
MDTFLITIINHISLFEVLFFVLSLVILMFIYEYLTAPRMLKKSKILPDLPEKESDLTTNLFACFFIIAFAIVAYMLIAGKSNGLLPSVITSMLSFFGLSFAIYIIFNAVKVYKVFQVNIGVAVILLIYPFLIIIFLIGSYFSIFELFVYASLTNGLLFSESTISGFTTGTITLFGALMTGFIAYNSHNQPQETNKKSSTRV